MSNALIFALVCAIAALVYGGWSIGWIMKKPAGNARMQEIAQAIQEGARAYLNRQYRTIGIVGVALFVVIGFTLHWSAAIGFSSTSRIQSRSHPCSLAMRAKARWNCTRSAKGI